MMMVAQVKWDDVKDNDYLIGIEYLIFAITAIEIKLNTN